MMLGTVVQSYLHALRDAELLIRLDWADFVNIDPPYPTVPVRHREVTMRYLCYGYEWHIHGTLYEPEQESLPGYALVLIHGGGVNEMDFHLTPDGRLGIAAIAASLGFRVLAPSYPGLWPRGGKWDLPPGRRVPQYVLDRTLSDEETHDRMLRATYPVYMRGIAALTDDVLGGLKLFAHGHSTGGRMAMDLNDYLADGEVVGVLGWGSGGPDSWRSEWQRLAQVSLSADDKGQPLGGVQHRTVAEYRSVAHYEDESDLTPWGSMEDRFRLVQDVAPLFNPILQRLSHSSELRELERYAAATGLPIEEYAGHIGGPNKSFVEKTKILLMVGENDYWHWVYGDRLADKYEYFVADRYASESRGTRLVVVPRYSHMGHWALHNERLVYLWLWAVKSGFFD